MNIDAAKSVADAVRTSLGPRGMDKMVLNIFLQLILWVCIILDTLFVVKNLQTS